MVTIPKYTIQLRRQIQDFEKKGYGIQQIINYLLSLNLEVREIISVLTHAPFSVKKDVLLKVLQEDFDFNNEEAEYHG